jgi:SAM-dependent methyltransferase
MTSTETFQLSLEMAEAYEARFVPALFGEWAERLVAAAGVGPGQRVLDVACGTGAVARAAAERTGGEGSVVGLDLNEAMITVAGRVRPDLEWRQGDAAELPFRDASFDVVLCQAALMFLPDVEQALREMARVVKPEGTVGVQVWDRTQDQPSYGPLIEVVGRHAGPEAINLVNTYFVRGDLAELIPVFETAGLVVTSTRTETSTMRYASVDEAVAIEVESTPLGESVTEDVLRRILEDARGVLRPFLSADGELHMPIGGHLIIARRR